MRARAIVSLFAAVVLVIAGGATAAPASADWRIDPRAFAARIRSVLPQQGRVALDRAVRAQADARDLGARLLGTRSMERMLLDAAARAGIRPAPIAAPPRETSLARAGALLIGASGLPLDAAVREGLARLAAALPDSVERPAASLASAMAVAERLRVRTFAALSPADLRALELIASHPRLLDDPPARARFERLAAMTDMGPMVAGAALVLATVDRILPQLRAAARGLPQPLNVDGCPGGGGGTDPALPVWITVAATDCWTNPHILSIDIGGSDTYADANTAGGAALGLSVHIDIDGNDSYHSSGTAGSVQSESVIEGAGSSGIGVLVDVGGNDRYNSGEVISGAPASYSVDTAQGAGVLGVGVQVDVGGADQYNSGNTITAPAVATYDVRRVQGAGVGGIGLQADIGIENDDYNSNNKLQGPPFIAIPAMTYVVATAQGSGDTGSMLPVSVGIHADTAGDDRYNSANDIGIVGVAATAAYTVLCSQGVAGTCDPQSHQDLPVVVGLGVLADGTGKDQYNSTNKVNSREASYRVFVGQGATNGGGILAGLMAEGPGAPSGTSVPPALPIGGFDKYNSDNTTGRYDVSVVQGASQVFSGLSPVAFGLPGVGVAVLADAGLTEDWYNAQNTSGSPFTVMCAQGCGATVAVPLPGGGGGGLALGVHVDISASLSLSGGAAGDLYNSNNSSGPETLTWTLGTGTTPGIGAIVAGVMLDLDLGDADRFNSGNSAAVTVASAEGAAKGPIAVGVFADTFGGNLYNAANISTTRSSVVASGASPPALGVYVDIGPLFAAADSWGAPATAAAPSYCSGTAVLLQLDGAPGNVPPPSGPSCSPPFPRIDN